MGMMNIGPALFYTSPSEGTILSTGAFNRGFGTFANPNATGAYLSISFFILLATNRWKSWIRFVLGSYLMVGIYSTGSMGAVISSFVSFAILVMTRLTYKNRRIALLTIGIVALAIGLFIVLILGYNPSTSVVSLAEKGSGNELLALTLGRLPHSIFGRINIIEDVLPTYYRYPLGIGPNAASLISKTLHNDYLAYLLERGPFGLIAWLWLVIATLITPLQKNHESKSDSHYWQFMALWAGFLAIVLNAFGHEVSHFRQLWMLMAFLYAAHYKLSNFDSQIPAMRGVRNEKDAG
jgi:hypothetical protein